MTEHQIHYEKKFYQDKKTGYWISTSCPKIRAHVWVWIYYHGKPPKGFHIHHKDGNKSNNSIENLNILTISDHVNHHISHDELRRKKSKEICDRVRPLAKAWHSSPEGKAWHKLHAIKGNFGNWNPLDYTCQECKKEYKSKKRSKARFCSNACKSKYRRNSGIDNIECQCMTCSKKFTKNKYSKAINCSKKCASTMRSCM